MKWLLIRFYIGNALIILYVKLFHGSIPNDSGPFH